MKKRRTLKAVKMTVALETLGQQLVYTGRQMEGGTFAPFSVYYPMAKGTEQSKTSLDEKSLREKELIHGCHLMSTFKLFVDSVGATHCVLFHLN